MDEYADTDCCPAPSVSGAVIGALVRGDPGEPDGQIRRVASGEIMMVPTCIMAVSGDGLRWTEVSFPYRGEIQGPLFYVNGDVGQDALYARLLRIEFCARVIGLSFLGCLAMSLSLAFLGAWMDYSLLVPLLGPAFAALGGAAFPVILDRRRSRGLRAREMRPVTKGEALRK